MHHKYGVNIAKISIKKFKTAQTNVLKSLFKLDSKCSISFEVTKRNINTVSIVQRKLIKNCIMECIV